MTAFTVKISNIQHVREFCLTLNLDDHKLTCLTGKNGVGKTTLIKAIQNLQFADTFAQTSASSIFSAGSAITYVFAESVYSFNYDSELRGLNPRIAIPEKVKKAIDVELPMPHGGRFNLFEKIVKADGEIRRAIILEQYEKPEELISLLNDIYGTEKFSSLISIRLGKEEYYCILLPDRKYIREDYLSSGEFFLISLYRKIKSRRSLIVIDEIDISLDAAAQTRLTEILRRFCKAYGINMLFTTHSLPLIRTLDHGELYYLESDSGLVDMRLASYNYVKSVLFGFKGWDRYILTEDRILSEFIEFLVGEFRFDVFYKYKIIYIGTAGSVVGLLARNEYEEFFSRAKNVIAILDGDQKKYGWAQKSKNTYFLPVENIEFAIREAYLSGKNLVADAVLGLKTHDPKKLWAGLVESGKVKQVDLFRYLLLERPEGFGPIIEALKLLLLQPASQERPDIDSKA